jgi:ubiquinol-cytochrome c reductase cytochrome b subunit
LAFGQTGYLLPWDQRSYWGTAVTLNIIGTIPLIGPKLAQFLRGGDAVGALTLSRFYSIHTVFLPLSTTLLVVGHLFLIRRFGISAPWTTEDGPRRTPFYPFQMVKDAAAILIVFVSLFILSSLLYTPLDAPVDPSDTTFVPRPDWYFLFLFQMLRYFEGEWEVVGTFVLPTLVLIVLFAIPFLDRNPRKELRHRPLAVTGLLLGIVLFGWLTYATVEQTPKKSLAIWPPGTLPPRAERIKRPSEVGGLYVLKQQCFECHSLTELGDRPNLQMLAKSEFPTGKNWFENHFQQHGKQAQFNDREIEELTSVLRIAASDRTDLLVAIPRKARFGGHFFYNNSCINCHTIDGQGGKHAEVPSPDLTLRLLRTKEWHMKHIHDAQSVVRNSKMPPFFHFEPYEYEALAEYILYLHTP